MKKSHLLGAAFACLLSISVQAAIVSMSTPDQNGVSITTILDTDNHQLTYEPAGADWNLQAQEIRNPAK